MQIRANSLKEGIMKARKCLHDFGETVYTPNWQGKDDGFKFHELLNLNLIMPMEDYHFDIEQQTEANLPWAKNHFEERVGGVPLNPPPSHTEWLKGTDDYLSGEKFSHSYPERMWPNGLCEGIRFSIGDLGDLVHLFKKDRYTRQGYLPIFFPEDLTAANLGERVPCTLGWHFIIRNDRMHCFYPMRSCDALRHFHNDMYFANMLALWIIEQAELGILVGNISFSCTSFHCFENDLYALKKSIGEK